MIIPGDPSGGTSLEIQAPLYPNSGGSRVIRGAQAVARRATAFSRADRIYVPALVNGAAGLVSFQRGQPVSVLGFTITGRKIVEIDILADPARLAKLDLENLRD